jgi:hypothetical protein
MAKKTLQLVPPPTQTPQQEFEAAVAPRAHTYLLQQIGNAAMTLARVMAERDVFHEEAKAKQAEVERLTAELAALKAPQV